MNNTRIRPSLINQFTPKFGRIWCFVNRKDVYTGQDRSHGNLIRENKKWITKKVEMN